MNTYLDTRSVRTFLAGAMVLIVACLGSAAWAAPSRVVWVAPDGDDSASGDAAHPLRTLEAARDAVRAMKASGGLPEGGVAVRLRPGTYTRRATFLLEEQDSGEEGKPVIYEGVSRDECLVSGGLSVPGEAFRPLTSGPLFDRLPPEARGKVVSANLRAHGYTDLKAMPDAYERGGGVPSLFFQGEPMDMARWPNEGFAPMGKTVDKGGKHRAKGEKGRGGTFQYEGDRPARWKVGKDLYLRGYLYRDWHHQCYRVQSIDTTSHTITLAAAGRYPVGGRKGFEGRYVVYNALEELDRPGEWAVDFASGEVAFWPPEPLRGRTVDFAFLSDTLVRMEGCRHVVLRNLTLELGRGHAINMHASESVRVRDCVIRNLDGNAIRVAGGRDCGVEGCEIYGMGEGGVSLFGGDRKKLEPAGHSVVNCHIHHYGRLRRTYAGGVSLSGVGNRAAHCLIHTVPHTAIFYSGNEHLVEYNELHHLMLETGDAGATYTGRDWTSQGNIVRYNYIHHLGVIGSHGSNGIYLDDCDSGDIVHGNIVWKAKSGMLMGGGRDNTVTNNIFIDCAFGFRSDSRGEKRMVFNTKGDSWDLQRKAEAMNYMKPPWSERYPSLARTMEEMPTWPMHNEYARNVIVRCKSPYGLQGRAKELIYRHDNMETDEDPGFVNLEGGNLRLRPDSIIYKQVPGFENILFDKIGLLKK